MKTVSTDLFDLIKSLSKQEKRYFKLYASRHVIGKQNTYVRLFDTIEKQKEYDEVKIKKKFEGETFVKQLHVTKNYLYNLILNSLRQFNEAKSEDKFPMLIRNVQLLIDKGLYKQSEKLLKRARKTALENEQFLQLLEVYKWEHRITHGSKDSKGLKQYIDVDFQQELEALDKYKNYLQFQLLHDQVFYRYWKKGSLRKQADKEALQQLFQQELYENAQNAYSFSAKMFYHNARFSYHYLAGELDKCYEHIRQQVALYENLNKSNKLGKRINRYIGSLNNLFVIQKQMGKEKESLQTIQQMRKLSPNSKKAKADIIASSYILEIDLYLSKGKFSKGIQKLQGLEVDLKNQFDKLDVQQRLILFYNLAYLYFGAGKFNRALDWINLLLNDPDLKKREDIHSFGNILNLLIHYELGNDDLLEYIVKSTYRFLSKRKLLFKVESIMLQFLKKYPNWINQQQMQSAFQGLHDELLLLTKDEYEKQAFEYFDFVSWLRGKMEKRKFEEIVKEKRKRIIDE